MTKKLQAPKINVATPRPIKISVTRLEAVSHDKKRWIFERDGVLLNLRVGDRQVFAWSLIFPSKSPALPHIGPSVRDGCFRGTALEAIGLRVGDGSVGRRLIKKVA
jgi:hypothetical protein